MIRRSHKKSRQGCAECKRSHKRCDENKTPGCINCAVAKKACSFTGSGISESPGERDFIMYTGPDNASQSRSPRPPIVSQTANSSPQPPILTSTSPTPTPEPFVNLLHLELFRNFTTDFAIGYPSKDLWVETIYRYTFSHDYLMYEALALSAFHLSVKNPSKSSIYLPEASALQAKAISFFTSAVPTVNKDNLLPAFLFSAILGLHYFCETFTLPSPDLDTFLDRLVHAVRILRGVHVLVGNNWEYIQNSDLKVLISVHNPVIDRDDEISHVFEDLRTTFTEFDNLSPVESKAYLEAISRLLWLYNSQPIDATSGSSLMGRMISAWPITLTAEYTELLNERKPEALLIMGYFSILLNLTRSFWAVGEAGSYLLAAIEGYLGEEWAELLAVPKRFVGSPP